MGLFPSLRPSSSGTAARRCCVGICWQKAGLGLLLSKVMMEAVAQLNPRLSQFSSSWHCQGAWLPQQPGAARYSGGKDKLSQLMLKCRARRESGDRSLLS